MIGQVAFIVMGVTIIQHDVITGEHNATVTTETVLSVTCGVYVEQYQKLRHQRLTSKVDFNEKQNNRRRQRRAAE